jgi:hypothetical protein
MPSNLFGAGSRSDNHRTAAEIKAGQEAAKTQDSAVIRAGAAAGRDSRSIGVTRTAYGRS